MRMDDMNAWLMEDMGGCMNDKDNGLEDMDPLWMDGCEGE